jgi:SsrA-binding protein
MDLLVNKKIRHNYEILEKIEAGIELLGTEVKSLRKKHGSLKESYIKEINNELFLVSAHIPPYQKTHALYKDFDSYRERKLLLHKKEIEKLKESQKQKGLTLVPVRIYGKGNLIKLELAVARGKKLHDKRADLKKRTAKREAERAMKYMR